MGRLSKSLSSSKLQLYVSLPSNDPAFAEAALEEGADGLKVHMNVSHRASGKVFRQLSHYTNHFQAIRSMFEGPLGIVPGGSYLDIKKPEILQLETMDFDFISAFAHHLPPFLLNRPNLEVTYGIDNTFDISLLEMAKDFPIIALEAAVIPPEEYGTPLVFDDVLRYRSIAVRSGLPVIVPSQRKIVPDDIPSLVASGVKALLIGAVVTGNHIDELRSAVASFRNKIDQM